MAVRSPDPWAGAPGNFSEAGASFLVTGARVLRPGGRLQIADIVVRTPPSEACRSQPKLWAECIVGATEGDCLSGNPETPKVAEGFGAHAIVFRACKP